MGMIILPTIGLLCILLLVLGVLLFYINKRSSPVLVILFILAAVAACSVAWFLYQCITATGGGH
ncbi:hypothetical protein LPW36_13045 [Jinshanibacter sp. LJY008]|uniref:Uncharacterized protein n=1 Tax=Limnobaculum eriocheiris TaxID=2897391 RepID=A0A9X1SQG1_9GAMM|nr:hypothetical protein [Limnobaculum eriocheiris]MCD1126907.1 hypothetical protein [Limnobaculum eriocheiris]